MAGLVSTLLAWVGFSPTLTTAPLAPVQSVGLWGLLAWVRREVQRTFFNQTPTTSYNPVENSQTVDGVVTGDLNAVDPDGDPLNFTVAQGPQNGSVVINPDGTFVYTPSAQLAATGGTDVFTVKLEDQGLHFHGVLGIFQPDFGHSTTATVPVTVNASIDVGDQPRGVAVSADGKRVYVVNQLDDDISVIDTATNTVVTTITVGDSPYGVATNPSAARAYVTNSADGTVSVINTATNTVATTITVGAGPNGVAVSADGATVYVTNFAGTVSVIDTATNTVTTTITVGNDPEGVAVSPDGATLYVTDHVSNSVVVIDTATNTVTTTITVGDTPVGVVVSPDGTTAYVVNNDDSDSVSVIDVATNTVVDTIAVNYPYWGAVSADGGRLYVTNPDHGTVSVIDTATNAVISTIAVGGNPLEVAINPDGTHIYVTDSVDDTLSVIDVSAPLNTVAMLAVPAMTAAPVVLGQSVGLRGLLDWVATQIQRTFFNQAPTISYNPALNSQTVDGVLTGALRVVDPDGDPVTLSVVVAPEYGSVVINRDGTFTYTPRRRVRPHRRHRRVDGHGREHRIPPVRTGGRVRTRLRPHNPRQGERPFVRHPDHHRCRRRPERGGGQPRRRPRLRHQQPRRHGVGDRHRHQHRHRHHPRRRHPARGGGQPRRHPRLRHQHRATTRCR